jgi:hypothetical protein
MSIKDKLSFGGVVDAFKDDGVDDGVVAEDEQAVVEF